MNEVEARLGLKPAQASVDVRTGKLCVTGWHGYEFCARRV
jgi:hypothetical protein